MSRLFEPVDIDFQCAHGQFGSPRRHLSLLPGDRSTRTQPSAWPAPEWRAVDFPSRLRRTAAALLMAMLLVAPLLDCTLHPTGEHAHSAGTTSMQAAAIADTVHLQGAGGHPGDHCDQHMIHCIEKSVLPARGTTVPPVLWMALIGAATVAVVTLVFTGARVIRGPPGAGSPVSNGRIILLALCICRR